MEMLEQCINERRVQQEEPRQNSWQWRAVVEKKVHRGRMWRIMGNEQFTRGMWEYVTLRRAEAKRIRDDAAREKQEGIQGQWQQESPFREVLEQARRNKYMGCSSEVIRKGCVAGKDSRWQDFKEECKVKGKSSEWNSGTVREKVVKEEAGRLGIVREILRKKHGFPEANHCAGRWNGRSHFVVCLPALQQFSSGRNLVCTDGEEALQLVVCNLWRKI